ncbi:MAG TPA: pentalenene synthase, partial [Streptomyces sp.]|nr:pentalenene synthase [Streptomyces sp.]
MTETKAAGSTTRRDGLVQRVALLEIPFPGGISPDVEQARVHTIRWLLDFGMLRGDLACAEYDTLRLERAMARFYPRATGDDLKLATDVNGWFFVFDDQFDGPLGRDPARAAGVCQKLIDIVHGATPGAGADACLVA